MASTAEAVEETGVLLSGDPSQDEVEAVCDLAQKQNHEWPVVGIHRLESGVLVVETAETAGAGDGTPIKRERGEYFLFVKHKGEWVDVGSGHWRKVGSREPWVRFEEIIGGLDVIVSPELPWEDAEAAYNLACGQPHEWPVDRIDLLDTGLIAVDCNDFRRHSDGRRTRSFRSEWFTFLKLDDKLVLIGSGTGAW